MTKSLATVFLAGLWLVLQSCSERSVDPPHEDRRSGRDRILVETIIGNADDYTSIHNIARNGSGALFFTGQVNNEWCVGRLRPDGELPWIIGVPSKPKDMILSPVQAGGIIVSALEPDLSVFSPDGNILHKLDFDDSSGKVCVYAAAATSVTGQGATFVAVGGKRVSGARYPILISIDMSLDGTLTVSEDTIFSGLHDTYFAEIAIDTTGESAVYYIIHNRFSVSDDFLHSSVLALSDAHEILWQDHLTGIKGISPRARDITLIDGGVAIAGSSRLIKNNEGEWDIFLVRAFESDGNVRWTRSLAMTDHSDRYYACSATGDVLLAAGYLSYFRRISTTRMYGFGILSQIDISTGEFLGHIISGNPDCSTSTNDVVSSGNTAYCVGWTEYFIQNGNYRGWYYEADLSDPAAWQKDLIDLPLPQSNDTGPVSPAINNADKSR